MQGSTNYEINPNVNTLGLITDDSINTSSLTPHTTLLYALPDTANKQIIIAPTGGTNIVLGLPPPVIPTCNSQVLTVTPSVIEGSASLGSFAAVATRINNIATINVSFVAALITLSSGVLEISFSFSPNLNLTNMYYSNVDAIALTAPPPASNFATSSNQLSGGLFYTYMLFASAPPSSIVVNIQFTCQSNVF